MMWKDGRLQPDSPKIPKAHTYMIHASLLPQCHIFPENKLGERKRWLAKMYYCRMLWAQCWPQITPLRDIYILSFI